MLTKDESNIVPPVPTLSVAAVRHKREVSRELRQQVLRLVHYNIFAFPAALTTVDYLSDSGTSAMTDLQWSAIFRGDESYGRNTGYYCLLEALRDTFERGDNRQNSAREVMHGDPQISVFLDRFLKLEESGFVNGGAAQMTRPNTFIVPQGRCAESLLFQAAAKLSKNDQMSPQTIISNGFFDTTKANALVAGFTLQTFVQNGGMRASCPPNWQSHNDFNGNMNITAAQKYLSAAEGPDKVAFIVLTLTNNWAAGQPVSLANIKATSELAKKYNLPLIFDACRFAENAMFIQRFEDGYQQCSIAEIIREMFSHADGFTISLKKDGLANMGGVLCLRDNSIFTTTFPGIGLAIREEQILRYGNDSYGGMSGRDLMAATIGLYEGTSETHLTARLNQAERFAEKCSQAGLPVLLPPGASAVFLDMDLFFQGCGRSYGDFAGLGFTLELLEEYGIRAFESGPFAWEWDKSSDSQRSQTPNLVRFAIPRNVMMDQHLDYTVAAVKSLMERRHKLPGVRIVSGKGLSLRHFQSMMEPIAKGLNN